MESENRALSKETLYNYLGYVISTFIMHKAGRYDLKGKKKLATMEKYYLTDMGIGRIRDTESHMNIGAALENVVYYPKYVISMDKWDFSRNGIIHKNAIDFFMEDK